MKKTVRTLLLLTTLAGLVGCGTKTSEGSETPDTTNTGNTTESARPSTDKPSEDTTSSVTPHVHTFTGEWKHDTTKHWKECDSGDGEKSEEADHVYTDGGHVCMVCGFDIYTEYGIITGSVTLHKEGAYLSDYSGVKIKADDKGVEISYNETDGTFSVARCEINKAITLTFEKDGYQSTTKTIMALEKGETRALGKPVTLEYQRFTKSIKKNWDPDKLDYSHVNDEEPYIGFSASTSGHTMICNTVEAYDDVYATWIAKGNGISLNNDKVQGIYLYFEETDQVAALQLNGNNYTYQANANFWVAENNNGETYSKIFSGWDGYGLNDDEKTKYDSDDGLNVGIVRRGSELALMVEGKKVKDLSLPEDLASKKCKVGYYAWDTGNADGYVKFQFDITTDFEAIDAGFETVATDNLGTIVNKRTHTLIGEKTDFEITPNDGYAVDTITNNDIDVTADYEGGHLRTTASKNNHIVVNFKVRTTADISATIVGIEFDGNKEHAFEDGKVFVLTGKDGSVEATTKDGKLIAKDIASGTYSIAAKDDSSWVAGSATIELANTTYTDKITLSENALKEHLTKWINQDPDCTNLKNGTFSQINSCMFVTTRKTFKQVAMTYRIQHNLCPTEIQGLIFRFNVGENNYKCVSVVSEANTKVQLRKDPACDYHINNGSNETQSSLVTEWLDLLSFKSDDDNKNWAAHTVLSSDELLALANTVKEKLTADKLNLTMVRDGVNFYIFLDNTYLAKWTVDEQYKDMEIELGVCYAGASGNDSKSFALSMTTDISSYLEKVNAK